MSLCMAHLSIFNSATPSAFQYQIAYINDTIEVYWCPEISLFSGGGGISYTSGNMDIKSILIKRDILISDMAPYMGLCSCTIL